MDKAKKSKKELVFEEKLNELIATSRFEKTVTGGGEIADVTSSLH